MFGKYSANERLSYVKHNLKFCELIWFLQDLFSEKEKVSIYEQAENGNVLIKRVRVKDLPYLTYLYNRQIVYYTRYSLGCKWIEILLCLEGKEHQCNIYYIGSKILDKCLEKKINIETLAKKIGIEETRVAEYIYKGKIPVPEIISAIADVLEVREMWLLGWGENEEDFKEERA